MVNEPAIAQKGLKVIGAGFGRTGTFSLKIALEELGFGPCYHMTEVFQHPDHLAHWETAAQGNITDWNVIFGEYQAAVDWPSCAFYEQLMRAYPDAKVLLSVRDPDHWYESVYNTIYQVRRRAGASSVSRLLSFVARMLIPGMRSRLHMLNAIIWDGTFADSFEDKNYAIAIFNRHNKEVQQKVPPEKLLVYNVKDGWEPLCRFLGVAVPENKPFPRLNDRDSFVGTRRIRRGERIAGAFLLTLLSSVLVALLLLLRRKRG